MLQHLFLVHSSLDDWSEQIPPYPIWVGSLVIFTAGVLVLIVFRSRLLKNEAFPKNDHLLSQSHERTTLPLDW